MSGKAKSAIGIVLFAIAMVAAIGAFRGPAVPEPGALTPTDQVWLKQRLARGPVPAPKPGKPQVLLLWRSPTDAPKVRQVANLVMQTSADVYGMDVLTADPLFRQIQAAKILGTLPAPGAWLVVLDKTGRQLGSTPIVNRNTIAAAFQLARGKKLARPLGEDADPWVNQPAPDFTTKTSDGRPFKLSAMKGHKLVLTFYCGCSKCEGMAAMLAALQATPAFKDVQFYNVTHMTARRSGEFSRQTGQKYVTLTETAHGIARLYDSITCPRVWYISPDGIVRYDSYTGEDPADVKTALEKAIRQ